ncbi:zinc ABC transporter substrate-binding protein [Vreelandella titanicae]|jgi:manganese/iron transport system substrate-binding protein|uniref:ABC transporter, metal-binding lipoprotein n=1 Tax=Vreelandella titanicae BH1 TaxID=1204738 RepID=L9U963_9GAMM|nr:MULTISPECIES: zinc ABC transporter substrate-binding protein [Halomonas]NAO98393.1 ABC transporter substrate-binding protein [Halomonas sp. MG34]QGQ72042.1 ABC transporter substrate-binding protein [Halomonas sp. PA16-9]UEQ02500.1 zinc ABC transporter substrate-binding protein [Halomonas profundus]ELY20788.1 ABC transporter, metal-binding lipoprotein [Halomonas titanicae BH1]KIN13444.1 ABC transporter substrate-binding protein [Halomonas sp. KHS3]
MSKWFTWVWALLFVALISAAPAYANTTLRVIASFSVMEELVKRVAGDTVSVNVIVPRGEDVHRWELTPPNVLALEETHIVFYNGLGLEPWIRHVEAMSDDQLTLVEVAKKADYTPLTISTGQYKGEPDPHMWMDPEGAAAYIDVIAETLAEHLPEQADAFYARADEARRALNNLNQAVKERLEGIPQTNRTLLTSEAGFGYFARAYAFDAQGVWGVNHETQGSAQAMAKISEQLAEKRPPALFFESTTPSIHMDALSREASLPLAGPLYVDSLSGEDGPAANYADMLRHNAEVMHTALGGATAE